MYILSSNQLLSEMQTCEKLKLFPQEIDNFTLKINIQKTDEGFDILTYTNLNKFAKISLFYNMATKDYILKEYLGLTEFCNIKFINPSRDLWLDTVLYNLPSIIQRYSLTNTNPILQEKGILQFRFDFPALLQDFQLLISPQKPFSYLSGSSIILDYTNFTNNKQFLIYYNEFRDDFFAEYRVNNILCPCNVFDCRTIEDLELLLEANLEKTLLQI